ncbi:hypothetical protein RHMOL_Rhmol07G0189100 [Rhododendron molle]|uniref:Uncharacterized protein n=1 Tax=Rhododendron molle TaxID=49168 RepID=A0ACC0N3A8_RHOML|nr:hypothetical protein RHMOL_Rhmol07G0189100 [Rhododendron molle]
MRLHPQTLEKSKASPLNLNPPPVQKDEIVEETANEDMEDLQDCCQPCPSIPFWLFWGRMKLYQSAPNS